MTDGFGKRANQSREQLTRDESQKRVINGSMDVAMSEKSPDDFSFEGGNDNKTGPSRGSAGDLRTLAAKDSPDDLE